MIVVAFAVAGLSLAATVEWLRPSLRRSEVQLARVERGAIEETLTANGTVVPLVEQVVSSPVEARVVRIGRRAGDRVAAGDELLTLDTIATQLDVARLGERLSQKESEVAQLVLQLDESIAQQRAQIEQKRLDVQILHYTSQQKEKLRAAGLTAEHDALAAAAQAKKSDIELRQLEEALGRALRTREAKLKASRLDLSIAQREREESRRQLELAQLRAPRAGVITWTLAEEGATVRRGDLLARIADLSAYRVVATVSDIHAARLAPGLRARVKLDETTTATGSIESVDPRIVSGVVTFSITLDQPAHPRLRNNLRADVAVITNRRPGALTVRRGRLGNAGANHLFVVRGENLVRIPVRFGLTGDERIELLTGVDEGDQVVVSDMADYQDVDVIRLR